jgi:type VI secretion system Hcp family effector
MEISDPEVWGETLDEQFGMGPKGRQLGAFEITKFDFGASTNTEPDKDTDSKPKDGQQKAGKTTAAHKESTKGNFTITKAIDKGSPDLFLACVKKKKLDWAIICLRETGEVNRKPFLVLEFTNLRVTSFKWDLTPGDAESAASMETVDFDFETILIKYSQQMKTGDHIPVKLKGWNYPDNKPYQTELPWTVFQPEAAG